MTPALSAVVIGGGPAGAATAGGLARAGMEVALIERSAYDAPRVGETLGAEVGPLLRELGAWDAVAGVLREQTEFALVRSAWGSDTLDERSAMLHPLGAGWHVERVQFDAALATWAEQSGARVVRGAGRCSVARDGDDIVVTPTHGDVVRARMLVDATGRGAPASIALGGRRWLAVDRQVAILARFGPGPVERGGELMVEAVEHGFWYSAPLPDRTLIAVLVTDADVLVRFGRDRSGRMSEALASSHHTAERVRGLSPMESPWTVRSDSGRLVPDRGPGWRAVGDAASATDPLGGNGVARALRSALALVGAPAGPAEPAAAERGFSDYLDQRAAYYALESRWPDAPFWARRRPPIDWRTAALSIAPDQTVTWCAEPSPHAEAMLPRAGLAALREVSATPVAAHIALRRVREVAPIGDRRLLVALQYLNEVGAVRVR